LRQNAYTAWLFAWKSNGLEADVWRHEELAVRDAPGDRSNYVQWLRDRLQLGRRLLYPDREPRVYGGVQIDLDFIDKLVRGEKQVGGVSDPRGALLVIALICSDPALSLVADTLTLPITIRAEDKRIAKSNQHNDEVPESTGPIFKDASLGLPEPIDHAETTRNCGPASVRIPDFGEVQIMVPYEISSEEQLVGKVPLFISGRTSLAGASTRPAR
jgi:hypothetical protein